MSFFKGIEIRLETFVFVVICTGTSPTPEEEREIQRTMLELLNQLDGFDSRGDVKVIMATNRIETLDPALIRPGKQINKISPISSSISLYMSVYP